MKEAIYARAKRASTTKRDHHTQSCFHSNTTHFLAGLIRCRNCNGVIVQISGKDGGYYGCYNAKRKACKNKLLVPRKWIETIIIDDLKEKFLTSENLRYIYDESRSYFVPHTNIQILALLDEEYNDSKS
jgi:hypothetical protein